MKRYIAPEVDIYRFCLTEDILEDESKTYSKDVIENEEITDPFNFS